MPKPPVRAQELAAELAQRIRAGEPGPGLWLPPERQLAEEHGVSRSTARAALQNLAELGLVQLVAGSGAQVVERSMGDAAAYPDVQQALDRISGQLADITARLTRLEETVSSSNPTA